MARPTLFAHRKFVRLAALIGGKAMALGSLEMIWESAYGAGDPLVGDADTVESIADWRGKRGALAAALSAEGSRFLDLGEDGLYRVHDLEDHAPDYVQKRWQREWERRAKGETLRSQRQAAARASWASRRANDYSSADANGGQLHGQLQSNQLANARPPSPAPAPTQISPRMGACAHDPSAAEQVAAAPEAIHEAMAAALAEDADETPKTPEAVFEALRSGGRRLTGRTLGIVFGCVRQAEVDGTLSWDVPKSTEKADPQAFGIGADPKAIADVVPTMRLVFVKAKAGEIQKADEVLRDPSFAFGMWSSKFTTLREEIRGLSPAAPKPKANGPPRDRKFGHARAEDSKHTTTGEVKL